MNEALVDWLNVYLRNNVVGQGLVVHLAHLLMHMMQGTDMSPYHQGSDLEYAMRMKNHSDAAWTALDTMTKAKLYDLAYRHIGTMLLHFLSSSGVSAQTVKL